MACSFASSTGPRLKACAAIGGWAQLDEAAAVTVATVGTGCGPPTAADVTAVADGAARVITLATNVAVPGADSVDDAVAVP